MGRLLTIFFVAMISVSCGGDAGKAADNSTTDTSTDNTTNGDNSNPTVTPPSIAGFDFSLTEGDFWEFGWDGIVSRFAQGSSGSTSNERGTFRLTLGSSSNIGGVTLNQILVSGNPKWGDTRDFTPRWTHIGIDSHKIYGSTDGSSVEVIFDAKSGAWTGGGFFSEWPTDTLIVASSGSIDNDYITDTGAIMVGRSSSQSQCETIGGIVICGDQSFTSIDREYFKAGVGLLGYRFFNSFSFSGGGFSSGGSDEYNVGLVASSLRGDVVDHVLETEPNNAVANAMPLTLPAKIRGNALSEGDTFYGGSTTLILNNATEVEPNDSDAGAQVLTLPVRISGTIDEDNLGTLTSSSPPGISTYQTSIEDWFHWQNDPQQLRFLLEYDASSGADLDLMVGGLDFFDTYSVTDNLATGIYQEEANLNAGSQTSATYRVVVDAFSTPNGSVDYTLRVDTFTTTTSGTSRLQNEATVIDWFRVNLVSSQSLSINVTGGPIVVLTDATGAVPIEVGIPQTVGESTSIQTTPLAAGEYRIGVSDEGVEYTLEVNAQ